MRSGRSKPSEAKFCTRSVAVSSNVMNTPGSPCSTAPRARNSIARTVLPHPARPATRIGLPLGNPPSRIWSRPETPEGTFSSVDSVSGMITSRVGLGERETRACVPADYGSSRAFVNGGQGAGSGSRMAAGQRIGGQRIDRETGRKPQVA